jgi:Phage integrase family
MAASRSIYPIGRLGRKGRLWVGFDRGHARTEAGGRVRDRATVIQKKTGRPLQFEITEQTRSAIQDWLSQEDLRDRRYLFPSRLRAQPHLSTRQYPRIVHAWVESAGLDSSACGTHSMRLTKAAQIYKKIGNLRAVQLLLGYTKLESTVRYLGIEGMMPSAYRSRSNSSHLWLCRPALSRGHRPFRGLWWTRREVDDLQKQRNDAAAEPPDPTMPTIRAGTGGKGSCPTK